MGLLFPDKTICLICRKTISSSDDFESFPAFLPNSHPLHKYSEGIFHRGCYENWEKHEEFSDLYNRFRKVWDSRPKNLKTIDEINKWGAEAFTKFNDEISS